MEFRVSNIFELVLKSNSNRSYVVTMINRCVIVNNIQKRTSHSNPFEQIYNYYIDFI